MTDRIEIAKLAAQAREGGALGGLWLTASQADAHRRAKIVLRGTTMKRAPLVREILRQHKVHRARVAARGGPPIPLSTRLTYYLRSRAQATAVARRAPTPTGWDWDTARITDRDVPARMFVLHAEYKHHYSRRAGDWWTGASYLVGYEDGQWWIERIPRTIRTVAEAVAHITPADVRRARDEGRAVIRQGDVFLVALKRGQDNLRDLPRSHRLEAGVLTHPQHGTVTLPPAPAWRAYRVVGVVGATSD